MRLVGPAKLPWILSAGDLAPAWSGETTKGTSLGSDSLAGKPFLVCFVPGESTSVVSFLSALAERHPSLGERGSSVHCVVREPGEARPWPFALVLDPALALTNACCLEPGKTAPEPRAVLVDGDGRVLDAVALPLSAEGASRALELVARHEPFGRARSMQAPLLHVPNVLDAEMCRTLVKAFEEGEKVQGTSIHFRNGKPVETVDRSYKNRRDHRLQGDMKQKLWTLLHARLGPAIRRAFHFEISRFEYIQVGCYIAEEKGHFVPHRDNTSPLSAHRRFAMSLNLNEGYEGGEIRFPEYGNTVYRPEPGAAVVFSCSLLHEATPVTKGTRYVLVSMFWSEAEQPIFVANRPGSSPAPNRAKQLTEDARLLREAAGDVAAFGTALDRAPAVVERLDRIHRELVALRDDLRSRRDVHVGDQLRRLPVDPSGLKLHFGCGVHRLKGWMNIDAHGGELAMDLRWRLPFTDGSVRFAFASHVVEHLYRNDELPRFLEEVHRVLAPGGVFRVVVPDIEKCLRAYASGDKQFFEDRKKTWAWAAKCKTPLDHFLMYAGANQALENFDGHKYGYDFETLSVAFRDAKFSDVVRSEFMASAHEALRVDSESHNATAQSNGVYYSLFVEAAKRSGAAP